MLHIPPTNLLFLVAKQEPYKKKAILNEKYGGIFFGKKSGERASRQTKQKTKRAMEVGRKTREKIVRWNQITAL